jgi:2-polyprenyl-3-methyl-5-hydroxy-6-metoxy-1,4-benzoquinol methylase
VDTVSRRERTVPLRHRVVPRLLDEAVRSGSLAGTPLEVLDCGGGSGSSAVPLAQAGARVTVVDISADALATLRRRATEAGVEDRVRAVQGDVEALGEVVSPAAFDLVLAHEVLEAVDSPETALAAVVAATRSSGRISIVIANPVASVFARALAGDIGSALLELRAHTAPTGAPLDVSSLQAMCDRLGLAVEQIHGVGVFTEFVPGAELDPGHAAPAGDALAEMEQLAADRSPYREIASRIHVLARRTT